MVSHDTTTECIPIANSYLRSINQAMRVLVWCTALLSTMTISLSATAGQQPDLYDDTVYRTFELVFDESDWHEALKNNYEIERATGETHYVRADLIVYDSPDDTTGTAYPGVGVQYKGNSSYSHALGMKKPYKVTMDAFVEGQDLYGFDKLTLNNGIIDPTKIREVIAYKIMNEFMPSPRANLVYVRSGTAGNMEELGIYTSVERVNKRFFRKHFPLDDGHRYKAVVGSMLYRGPDPNEYNGNGVSRDRYTVNGGDPDSEYQDLINACYLLNNESIGMLDRAFSVDRLCWQAAAGKVLLNWDDLSVFAPRGRNYYLYQDTHNDQLHILPWDWDLAFNDSPDTSIFWDNDPANSPMTSRGILGDDEITGRYLAHLRTIASRLDWSEIERDVIRHRAWTDPIITTEHENELFDHLEYTNSHTKLSHDIQARKSFLNNHVLLNRGAPLITGVSNSPEVPTEDETVVVTARVSSGSGEQIRHVLLYSRDRGSYGVTPMFDDGAHQDGPAGDRVYGATIQAHPPGVEVEYYIEAAGNHFGVKGFLGAKRFEPIYAEHQPFGYQVRASPFHSPVVINEFMADNDTTIQDPDAAGEFPDWLELHNTSDTDIDLGGYFLTDDLDDPTQFEIADGVTIPAGSYLLFLADNDTDQGPLHTNFKLSKSGEQVGLFAPLALGNGMADGYTFGAQITDISEGRSCDGDDAWMMHDPSTPGAHNGSCASGCPADINSDGVVDMADLGSLIASFGTSNPAQDLNGDGIVDTADLGSLIAVFGQSGCASDP